jgi:hypothetical protein
MKSASRMKKTITAPAAYCPMAIAPRIPRVKSACEVTCAVPDGAHDVAEDRVAARQDGGQREPRRDPVGKRLNFHDTLIGDLVVDERALALPGHQAALGQALKVH